MRRCGRKGGNRRDDCGCLAAIWSFQSLSSSSTGPLLASQSHESKPGPEASFSSQSTPCRCCHRRTQLTYSRHGVKYADVVLTCAILVIEVSLTRLQVHDENRNYFFSWNVRTYCHTRQKLWIKPRFLQSKTPGIFLNIWGGVAHKPCRGLSVCWQQECQGYRWLFAVAIS